jgi:hypothetical protein
MLPSRVRAIVHPLLVPDDCTVTLILDPSNVTLPAADTDSTVYWPTAAQLPEAAAATMAVCPAAHFSPTLAENLLPASKVTARALTVSLHRDDVQY